MEYSQEMLNPARIRMPMCKRVVNTDISEDITLADYYPEIRRVICVRENLLPPAKFINGNKVDVSGVVDYSLIYVSAEGKLSCAPLSAEYYFSLPLENIADFEISEGVSVLAHSVAESSTVRVSAPRKLQLRSRIRSSVSAWGKRSCVEKIDGLIDPSSVERLSGEALCADIICENSDIVTLEAEEALACENCRVMLADGVVKINDFALEGELVRINGEVAMKLLVACEAEDKHECIIKKLPFEAESDIGGIDESDNLLRVVGSVSDIDVSVEEGKASVRCDIILELCSAKNEKVSYARDIYSVRQETEAQSVIYSLPVILENRNFNFSQNERIALSELNFPIGAEIVDAHGSAAIDEVIFEGGKYLMSGSCRYNLICFLDGEYSNCEVRVPFKYECDGKGDIDCFDAVLTVGSCRAREDGDYIDIDTEIFASCSVFGKESVEMLASVRFFDEFACESGVWTVCYLDVGEDSWSVAKKYRVREAEIIGDSTCDRFVMIEK